MDKKPLPTRFAWLMLILAFSSSFTMHLLLFSYSLLKEAMIFEMQLTYTQAGFIFSVSVFALVILRVPWGLVIDRIGVKLAIGSALTLLAVFGVLRSFAINYETLLLIQLFLGVGFAAIMPCLPKIVASWVPSEKTAFGMGVAISGFALGDIVALSGTPYFLARLGSWRQVFLMYGIWAFVLVIFCWLVFMNKPTHNGKRNLKPEANNKSITLKSFFGLLKMKQLWLLTGLYLCAGGTYDTLLIWLPSFLESEGLSPITSGLFVSMLPIGFLIASFAIGILSDRIGLRKPFILVLGLVSGPTIYVVGTLWASAAWFFALIIGLCTMSVLTLVLTIPVELEQTKLSLASAVGLITSAGNLGSFLLPSVVGYIKDVTGSFFWAVLLLTILGEFMFILGLPLTESGWKKKRKTTPFFLKHNEKERNKEERLG